VFCQKSKAKRAIGYSTEKEVEFWIIEDSLNFFFRNYIVIVRSTNKIE